MSLCCRFSCNFGPKDYTNVLLEDMLLLFTQYCLHNRSKNHQMNGTTSKKKGEKALVEFPKSSQQSQQKTHI
jgi:hypothetical protein